MKLTIPDNSRFTLREVAALLGKNLATIWRWTLNGVRHQRLKSFLIGGQRYVDRKDLIDFIDAINCAQIANTASAKGIRNLNEVDSKLDCSGF